MQRTLDSIVATCFYRVLQEALQNALKHSHSQSLYVLLKCTTGKIQLTVRDFGIGFDTAAAMKGKGLGLTTMQERLKLVNGELLVESRPQNGTTIDAKAPLR